jgi:alpha/beta superfamily hydrolase
MMARGLEQDVVIPRSETDGVLEGIFLAGEGPEGAGAVIAAPHPLYGGSMESPVVNEIAYACQGLGIASLRFNWRGVGGSSGEASGEVEHAEQDFAAALAQQAESVSGPLVACGYSFGAVAAVWAAASQPRVKRLVLISPPPSLLQAADLAGLGVRLLVLAGSCDELAPPAELEKLLEGVPGAGLERIAGADHFFATGLGEIGRAVSRFLE